MDIKFRYPLAIEGLLNNTRQHWWHKWLSANGYEFNTKWSHHPGDTLLITSTEGKYGWSQGTNNRPVVDCLHEYFIMAVLKVGATSAPYQQGEWLKCDNANNASGLTEGKLYQLQATPINANGEVLIRNDKGYSIPCLADRFNRPSLGELIKHFGMTSERRDGKEYIVSKSEEVKEERTLIGYKLKQHLPGIPAGTQSTGFSGLYFIFKNKEDGIFNHAQFSKAKVEENPDWFEPVYQEHFRSVRLYVAHPGSGPHRIHNFDVDVYKDGLVKYKHGRHEGGTSIGNIKDIIARYSEFNAGFAKARPLGEVIIDFGCTEAGPDNLGVGLEGLKRLVDAYDALNKDACGSVERPHS